MGEEEKKPGEAKAEEAKPAEKAPAEEEKAPAEEDAKESPPPPPEIVLKVYMHCEGCARKVRRCLKGFQGVEDVTTDCRSHKVVVKGEKADPLKVLERVQRKSHRQVELLSPIPKPPAAGDDSKKGDDEEKPKAEEKKEEPPPVIMVVIRVHMHCEACAQEIKKRIQRMKGVESVDPDLKSSQVAVKGVFDPVKLVEYVYKRTGKHAAIVKQDPPANKEDPEKDKDGKEEKKPDAAAAEEQKPAAAADDADSKAEVDGGAPAGAGEFGPPAMDVKKYEYYYQYPHPYLPPVYAREMAGAYTPQIFSDENPNACSVM